MGAGPQRALAAAGGPSRRPGLPFGVLRAVDNKGLATCEVRSAVWERLREV